MNDDEIRIRLILSKRQLKGFLALSCLFGLAYALHSETLTYSTVYPAPAGIYKKLIATADALLARDGGKVGIGLGAVAPTATLDVKGTVKIVVDGTQRSGMVLSSDDAGNASWQYAVFAP